MAQPPRRATGNGEAGRRLRHAETERVIGGRDDRATRERDVSGGFQGNARSTPCGGPALGEEAEGGWPQRYCARLAQCVRPSRGLLQSVSVAGASSPTAPALGAAGSSSAT